MEIFTVEGPYAAASGRVFHYKAMVNPVAPHQFAVGTVSVRESGEDGEWRVEIGPVEYSGAEIKQHIVNLICLAIDNRGRAPRDT